MQCIICGLHTCHVTIYLIPIDSVTLKNSTKCWELSLNYELKLWMKLWIELWIKLWIKFFLLYWLLAAPRFFLPTILFPLYLVYCWLLIGCAATCVFWFLQEMNWLQARVHEPGWQPAAAGRSTGHTGLRPPYAVLSRHRHQMCLISGYQPLRLIFGTA